jgi:hypothetical protein
MNSINRTTKVKETNFKPDIPLIKTIEKPQPTILKIECNKETITAYLSDSRVISIPTGWYKVLREATVKQLKNVKIMPAKQGIY